jgi:hypothetical protein
MSPGALAFFFSGAGLFGATGGGNAPGDTSVVDVATFPGGGVGGGSGADEIRTVPPPGGAAGGGSTPAAGGGGVDVGGAAGGGSGRAADPGGGTSGVDGFGSVGGGSGATPPEGGGGSGVERPPSARGRGCVEGGDARPGLVGRGFFARPSKTSRSLPPFSSAILGHS